MITQENRIKLWKLVKRVAYKNQIIIPDSVYSEYNDCMKTVEGDIRYIIIEYYTLDLTFLFEAYEICDLKSQKDLERMAEMYEDFFNKVGKGWNTVLMVDLKTMKPYYLSKEVKEDKKTKLEKVKYIKKLI